VTVANPIFLLDVSDNQPRDLNFARVKELGYQGVIARCTGGMDVGGTIYRDRQIGEYMPRIVRNGFVPGVYGFPLGNTAWMPWSAREQAEAFLDLAGETEGKLIAVDYETYGPDPALTASPQMIKDYIREIRRHVGPTHPIIIYAGKSFWEEPPHSGQVVDYGPHLVTWAPFYWTMEDMWTPQQYYRDSYQWVNSNGVGYWSWYGGRKPMFSQFSGSGKVANATVDCNAFRGTREQLMALTRS
jgi:hypothetical protein